MKTTTVIRDLPALFISGLLFFLWPSRGVQAQSQTPSKGTYARQIADTALSGQPLRAVGDVVPDEAEAKALADALGTEPHKTTLEAAPDLEFFVQNHPNSPYTPSVRASLAKSYAENGRYTPALQHWEASWDATKNLTGNGKEVADFALAHYTRLLANLGRTDRLSVIYQETQGRMLDYGPLQVLYDATFEAVNAASSTPDLTMGCGGYALAQVANALNVSPENRRRIVRAPMPPRGYSLKDLTDLAAQAGLDMIPVVRPADALPIVPSVLHLLQNHYLAVVGQKDDLYLVVDAALGRARWLPLEGLNAEASGKCLASRQSVPKSWKILSPEQSAQVMGKGFAAFIDNNGNTVPCATPCCPPGAPRFTDGPGSDCPSCTGMPRWTVAEPYLNLWVVDEPLFYQPAYGERIAMRLSYKQRPDLALDNNRFGFGRNWNCSWLSFVQNNHGNPEHLYVPGGGVRDFVLGDNYGMHFHEYASGDYMDRLTDGDGNLLGFRVFHSSGAYDDYTTFRNPANKGTSEIYLTQKVDAQGQTVRFNYTGTYPTIHLTSVVDATGKTTTLSYSYTGVNANNVSQVVDPFYRSCSLYYDSSGYLISITDVGSLSSSFAYDTSGYDAYNSLTNLHTPYGDTGFSHSTWLQPSSITNSTNRCILVYEPQGKHQLFLYRYTCEILSDQLDAGLAYTDPANVRDFESLGVFSTNPNSYMQARNSFYWGRQQFAQLPANFPLNPLRTSVASLSTNDYARARLRHWSHVMDNDGRPGVGGTLIMEQEPSPEKAGIAPTPGKMTWYDTGNAAFDSTSMNTTIYPKNIARVLPDGTVWYEQNQYNLWGHRTQVTSTYTFNGQVSTRSYQYIYDPNGVDLVAEIGPDGSVKAGYFYTNSTHQVCRMTNAAQEVTYFTYNARGQLTGIQYPSLLILTNIYDDPDGRLSQSYSFSATNGLTYYGTNTYIYYTNGLVATNIDAHGLTRIFTWDNLQRPEQIVYPQGGITLTYANLDLARIVDQAGNTNGFLYDAFRRLRYATNALTNVTSFDYCDCGALEGINEPLDRTTTFVHDNQGNLTYAQYPGSYLVTQLYDSLRRLTNRTDSAGASTSYFYNNQGLLTGIKDTSGWLAQYTYDIHDRVVTQTDRNGISVSQTYDSLNRLLVRTYPAGGGNEQFGYTPNVAAPTSYTNQLGNVTRYAYDAAGRLTNVVAASGTPEARTNSYVYTPAGDLRLLNDGGNHKTSWGYDAYGRLASKTDNDNVEILRYQYDPIGRLTNAWSLGGTNIFHAYDRVGNLTHLLSSDFANHYAYDALNRLTGGSELGILRVET